MNRRDFVKKGALLSVATPNVLYAGKKYLNFSSEPIRIGIIGLGIRGNGIARLLGKHPSLKLVAGCDILETRRNQFKEKYNSVKLYTAYQDMLANKEIDAVIIATHLSSHYQIASDAIDANKHIYCEKAMTHSIGEAKKLVQKVENSNLIFQVGHQYRSTPLYYKVCKMIREGYIGDVHLVQASWSLNRDWRREVDIPENEKIINWRMYREYSGGLMAELMSHQIDYVNWVFEKTPNKVYGSGSIDRWEDGRETFDNVNCTFVYDKMKLNCIASLNNSYEGYTMLFKGTKGTIRMKIDSAEIYSEDRDKKVLGNVDGVSGATIEALSEGKGVPIYATEGVVENWGNSDYALDSFSQNINKNKTPDSNVITGGKTAICVKMSINAMLKQRPQNWKESYELS